MFGSSNKGRQRGLLGGLLGGSNRNNYANNRRGGLLGNPLAQAALVAGIGWLGNRIMQGRQGSSAAYNQAPTDQATGSTGSWGNTDNSQFDDNSGGKSW